MKKRIISIFLTVLLALLMVLPVSADDSKLYIIDQRGNVTGFIPELNAKASAISDTYGFNVSILLAESTGGQGTVAYSEQIYQGCFGESDGIMLIESTEDQEWYLYKSGSAVDLITVEDEDALWAEYDYYGYYDEAVDAYLDKAQEILEAKTGIVMDEAALEAAQAQAEAEEPETEEAVEEEGIPAERLRPRLVDGGDLLTDSEEEELLSMLDEISERQQCDVVVVTTDSLNGRSAMECADDFYDYNGYGFGENRDGILLLISMEERDWHMSTCGYGITAFTDAGMDYMADKFTPLLSDGFYSEAFTKYATLCDEFITQAKTGKPYDKGNLPKGTISPIMIPISVLIGIVIAFILGKKKKAGLKSVVKKAHARDYAVPGSLRLTSKWDRMVNKIVTQRTIVKEDSGGSSTHTSSSGTTHGGSGGKF